MSNFKIKELSVSIHPVKKAGNEWYVQNPGNEFQNMVCEDPTEDPCGPGTCKPTCNLPASNVDDPCGPGTCHPTCNLPASNVDDPCGPGTCKPTCDLPASNVDEPYPKSTKSELSNLKEAIAKLQKKEPVLA